MKTVIHNGNVIKEDGIIPNASILIETDRIIDIINEPYPSIADAKYIDANGNYISPGFIDTHVHGGGGFDIMDGTEEAVTEIAYTHLKYGMTSFVPTTLTASEERLFKAIDTVEYVKNQDYIGSRILGIHLEGPYISHTYKGAQNPRYIAVPSNGHYKRFLDHSPSIKRISAAPELDGAMEMARDLKERGIVVAVAHSDADFSCMELAAQNGFSHITHMFNGMSALKSPDYYCRGGVVEGGLILDEFTAEIIADGKHMPGEMLRLLYKCKGPDKMILTTDAMRATDMPYGIYDLGGLEVLIDDGVAMLSDRTSFAGSIATADRLVRTAYRLAGIPLAIAVKMISINPAKLIGVDKELGSIDIGKIADIVIFDDDINIKTVIQSGKIIIQN